MTVSEPARSTAVLSDIPSHGRALAKAVSWRAVGTLDTFIWSLIVTGHASWATAIASTEILTKIALFYVHERVWRLLRWSPNARLRSLVKAVSWRFFGSLDTFALSLLFTGSAKYAVTIATTEALTKIALYYVHERVWRQIAWGRLEEKAAA